MKTLAVLLIFALLPFSAIANEVLPHSSENQELSFDFGDVPIGEAYYTTFDLTAPDDQSIEISDIMIDGEMYSAFTNCPDVLEPGESCQTEVVFEPTSEDEHFGELDFFTNVGNIRVYLAGTGVAAENIFIYLEE